MAKIVIVGAGMMGSALSLPLVDRGHEVRLVGTHKDEDIIASLKERSYHPKLQLELPRAIRAFSHTQLDEASHDVDCWALGVSSAGIAWATGAIAPHYREARPMFMITKGLVLSDGALRTLPDVVGRTSARAGRARTRRSRPGRPAASACATARAPACSA